MVRVAPNRGWMADSEMGGEVSFRETRGAHAGRESQPGKRIEFVVNIKGLKIGVGRLADDEGRISAAIIESGSENLVVMLVEAEEPELEIVDFVISGKGGLASGVVRGAVFGGGDGIVVGTAGVVSAVVVVERRNRCEKMRIEGVQPGEEQAGIDLGLAVAKIEAGVESSELSRVGVKPVLNVVGIGIIGNLEVIASG